MSSPFLEIILIHVYIKCAIICHIMYTHCIFQERHFIIRNNNIHRAYTHIHNTAQDSIEASDLMLISNTAKLYLNVETYIHRSGKCAHCTCQNNT